MERGYIDPNGCVFVTTKSVDLAPLVNVQIDLNKKQYKFMNQVLEMNEITFMEEVWEIYVKSPWRGIGINTEFDYSKGQLYDTKDSIIFIGYVQEYGIYGPNEDTAVTYYVAARAHRAQQLRNLNYRSFFMIEKSKIKGYRRTKKEIEIFCISNEKKMKIILSPQSKKYDIDRFTFLVNYPEIRDIKGLDKRYVARKSDRKALISKIEFIIVIPIMTGFFGFSFLFFGTSIEQVAIGAVLAIISVIISGWTTLTYWEIIRKHKRKRY